jgi:hypothetical protein
MVLALVAILLSSNASVFAQATDTTPPSVPSNLNAVPGQTSDSLMVTWTAATDDVGVAGYALYRNGVQVFRGMPWTPQDPWVSERWLTPNTTYSYQVEAYDAAGNVSAKSAVAQGTTLTADTTAPSAPTNLQAIRESGVKFPANVLTWTAAIDNRGVVDYKITRVYSDGSTTDLLVGNTTTYKDYPPAGGKGVTFSYYYVQAVDADRNISAPSNKAVPTNATTDSSTFPIDISWPQCSQKLGINKRDFVIVGVNGGLATTTNSCLSSQLAWAASNPVQLPVNGVQPKIQLYVNTANPGGLSTASWPSSNLDPAGNTAPNPYGLCDGNVPLPRDTLACAWQYGWNRAVEDVSNRFKPAASAAGINPAGGAYTWWLDVEIENTWKDDGSAFAYQSNVAVLEGMTSHFQSLSARVGLYSTGYQWGQVVGSAVGTGSNLRGLASWLAGAGTIDGARQNCTLPALTAGGRVTTTQYLPSGSSLDYNYSCVN